VLARLDPLEPAAQTAARLLAVIGQPTGLVLLQQLNRAEQAARGVEELVEVGLVAAEVGAETRYGYRHPLVAETVYESIPAALRRTLHGEVAAALEQQYGGQAGPWLAVLAEHTLRAGQQEAASRHFLTAARYAHGRYATQEAVALYRQALATTPAAEAGPAFDPALALAIREPLGEVLALSGAYDEARAQFEALIAQLERLGPQELRVERARLLRRIGTTHEQQGQLDQALEVLGRAAAVVAAAPLTTASAVEYAGIFSEIGWVNFRRGELSDAQEALERALELLQLYDAEAERAQVLNRLGGVAWQQGMLGVAQEYVAQSLAIHERRGDLLGQGHALANLGVLAEVQGLSSEARQYGERAFAAHERTGYKRFMAVAANNVAVACYDDEDFVDSVRWSTRAATTAEEIRDDYALAFAYLNQGRALVRLGIWDDAFESLTHSYNITRRFGFVTELLDTRIALIELELGRGNTETAVEQYDVLLREVSETEGQEYGRLLRLGGAMKAVQGDNVAALDLFDAAVVLFTRLRLAPEVARTERLRAQALENKEAS
jgi:tetratricopeptide (TPR) repeat protein